MKKKKHLLVKPSHNLMFAGKIVGWRRACGGGDTLNWKLERYQIILKFTINSFGAGQRFRVQRVNSNKKDVRGVREVQSI